MLYNEKRKVGRTDQKIKWQAAGWKSDGAEPAAVTEESELKDPRPEEGEEEPEEHDAVVDVS